MRQYWKSDVRRGKQKLQETLKEMFNLLLRRNIDERFPCWGLVAEPGGFGAMYYVGCS